MEMVVGRKTRKRIYNQYHNRRKESELAVSKYRKKEMFWSTFKDQEHLTDKADNTQMISNVNFFLHTNRAIFSIIL